MKEKDLPENIGGYQVLEKIASGGMGVVYLAEQKAPVQRRVALKLLKPGLQTEEWLGRFDSERQSLARMQHPNIASILDAGSTLEGRPYFAMEYVPGLPITTWCDQEARNLRQRLGLFRSVCLAVQHAHQKGVIHRDLKPANVLVTEQDGQPTARIIDFGIAKTLDPDGQVQLTHAGTDEDAVLGTPSYMSPEQAAASAEGIDTRTDVYSLGVILYELLVGQLPFEKTELRNRSDAARPSTRVGKVGEDTVEVAGRRNTNPRTLFRRLRGDLDWICLKALAVDRERRYPTAAALAEDIDRFLQALPVAAGPPSTAYRVGKFIQRHQFLVAVAAVILLSLVLGAVFSSSQYLRAEGNLGLAQEMAAEAADQRRIAENRAKQVLGERRRAVREAEGAKRDLARFDLLANVIKLREAESEADRLHPAWPRMAPAMDKWLKERVQPLLSELPKIHETVTRLKATDLTGQGEESLADRYLFEELTQLLGALETFADEDKGTVSRVRQRLAWAETIREKSIVRYQEQWDEAIAAISKSDGLSASKLYRGLEIRPQVGLVPIGMDPESRLWEFAQLRSGVTPIRHPETRKLRVKGETALVFVLIPGGSFMLGSQNSDSSAPNYDPQMGYWESPPRKISLGPFFLSKYEMTQGQWHRLSGGELPSLYGPQLTSWTNPVERVRWEMCSRLLETQGLLLPTEAQWEYACRAGTTTPWYTGVAPESLAGHANIADLTVGRASLGLPHETWLDDGYVKHAPVGLFRPNDFGLHDMHGNVAELCRDSYGPQDLPLRKGDGLRQASGDPCRVFRGGDYTMGSIFQRLTRRNALNPGFLSHTLGLRPARAILR